MEKPTPMEACMITQLGLFLQYSDKEEGMTKDKFMKLVKEQMPAMAENLTPEMQENMFKGTDCDNNGVVSFREFSMMVTIMCDIQMKLLKEMSESAQQQRR